MFKLAYGLDLFRIRVDVVVPPNRPLAARLHETIQMQQYFYISYRSYRRLARLNK